MFLGWKNQYCENDYTIKSNLQKIYIYIYVSHSIRPGSLLLNHIYFSVYEIYIPYISVCLINIERYF